MYCYTPPIYLIDPSLNTTGGNVTVSISSNNRDFSTTLFVFQYDPVANITGLDKLWVVKDSSTIVSITGKNFIPSNYLL